MVGTASVDMVAKKENAVEGGEEEYVADGEWRNVVSQKWRKS
jgi:hypothetical protein